jgi:UDP-N-acetylglucosamine 4-epimerase
MTGFVNMLMAARDAGVKRFVYASSSSVYGDSKELPKVEKRIGNQLSPYAVSKYANELYAKVFGRCYGLETIGLRYFNVFGPRQDPNGPYAAVIPRWMAAIKSGKPVQIYGDGQTSRDFTYVDNAVQANLLAGLTKNKKAVHEIYNVACGTRTSLNELYSLIANFYHRTPHPAPRTQYPKTKTVHPRYLPERAGDIRHSLASLRIIKKLQNFRPTVKIWEGINKVTRAFFEQR